MLSLSTARSRVAGPTLRVSKTSRRGRFFQRRQCSHGRGPSVAAGACPRPSAEGRDGARGHGGPELGVDRRQSLLLSAAGVMLTSSPAAAAPQATVALDTEWATESFAQGTDFSLDSYASMRDDGERTSKFVEAIDRRLRGAPGELTVVDVGTGPFALLAVAAARAGAKKVYAIEADPKVASLARKAVSESGLPEGTIEVVEGLSTAVDLPEKVDVLVAEVIGSVATEEGVYRTISDAQQRFLKDPSNPWNYIPLQVQTLIAPASYAFHYMIAAEGRKAAGLTSEEGPLRLNCQDQTLAIMDDPQLFEDFRYDSPSLPGPGVWTPDKDFSFTVSRGRLSANTRMYMNTLGFEGLPERDALAISSGVARGFSGLALWPRLILNPEGDLVVNSRSADGGAQKSHWQTVLPLMTKAPLPLSPDDTIRVSGAAVFGGSKPMVYKLHADVLRA